MQTPTPSRRSVGSGFGEGNLPAWRTQTSTGTGVESAVGRCQKITQVAFRTGSGAGPPNLPVLLPFFRGLRGASRGVGPQAPTNRPARKNGICQHGA